MTNDRSRRVEGPCHPAGHPGNVVAVTTHGQSCAPGAASCGPCIAQLSTPRDRIAAMREAIANESEPIVTLTHLLHLCRDEHRALWESTGDPRNTDRVASIRRELAAVLPGPSVAEALDPPVRRTLVNALPDSDDLDLPPVVIARTLAELIDERYSHTFAESFRRRSPYQPGVGDPVPLDSPDLRDVLAMRSTSPPWRLANRLDETRHIRLAGEWAVQFRIIFDYSLFETFADAITADTVVATCHPNRSLAELDLSRGLDRWTFPIGPLDPARQHAEINRLIATAATAGAQIVVLPELCITEDLAASLQQWVRRPDGLRLLVAGSYHHDHDRHPAAGSRPNRRRNTAIGWVRGSHRPLLHDKYSPADRPVVEGIEPEGWPQVRIYVTADGWHLAIVICRDLLNPQAVNALSEAGVNLLLVPTMSETLMTFGGPVAHLVGARQALVAIANNPGAWAHERDSGVQQPARALFGHPGLGQQIRLVNPPDPGPGVALMRVHSASITWIPATPDPTRARSLPPGATWPTAGTMEPPWLAALVARTERPDPPGHRPSNIVQLRRAAVLVLLTDGPDGPCVLLTKRAADLADYPGQLVFPGGAVDAQDDGPVATALREAVEEVGLDPDSVEVIGLLPPQSLPDTGFLVDPVLAWAHRPKTSRSVNYAEVTATYQVPLRELAQLEQGSRSANAIHSSSAATGSDLATLGSMTSSVIDQLLAMLPPASDGNGEGQARSAEETTPARVAPFMR